MDVVFIPAASVAQAAEAFFLPVFPSGIYALKE